MRAVARRTATPDVLRRATDRRPTGDSDGGRLRALEREARDPRALCRSRGWFGARHCSIGFLGDDPGGVTLVCAPAGSGKTVLVALVDRKPPGWKTVSLGSRSSATSTTRSGSGWRVIAALADAGGIVQRVDPAPSFRGRGGRREAARATSTSLEEPAALVIDDLHELRSPDALRWLEVLLAALPSTAAGVPADPRGSGPRPASPAARRQADRAPGRRPALHAARRRRPCFGPRTSHSPTRAWACSTSGRRDGRRVCGWPRSRWRTIRIRSASSTEFSGSERTVARYLLEEVLEHQPPEVRAAPAAHLDPRPGERPAGGPPHRADRARSASFRNSRTPTHS